MTRYQMPEIVVMLPGITGSVLKKNGNVVWGYSASSIGKALFTMGASMQSALALPYDDPEVDDLGDGVTADALMPDLHLLPGIWKIDGYTKIADALLANFELTEGENFFRFPYDWRRDNRVAGRKLACAARGWLKNWRSTSGNGDAKLILIAHSMGGLVSRYFLECLEGWKDTKALITFGTPYRGSLNALEGLANGFQKGPLDLSGVARQLTALYQLLPVFECFDVGDAKLVRVGETKGIPNVSAEMAASALKFHREIEAAVTSNRKLSQYQTSSYQIYPVVGVSQETNLSARLVGQSVEMSPTYEGKVLGGDGTVPRFSAIPLELSDNPTGAVYAATQHGSLQNADAVIEHIVGLLSGLDLDLGSFKKPRSRVSVEVADVFFADEPIVVRARPSSGDVSLKVSLLGAGDSRPAVVKPLQEDASDWLKAEFPPPGAGAYRVTVTGADVEPAEDSFAVVELATGAH